MGKRRLSNPKQPRKVRPPKPIRPCEQAHWLDRHERERELQDEALRRLLEAEATGPSRRRGLRGTKPL
jgi:hypothetical protein